MYESRVYVKITGIMDPSGKVTPQYLEWEDGHTYKIDRVSGCKLAETMKAKGNSDRYTIWIKGQERYLYFERGDELVGNRLGRWYIKR